MAACKNLSNIFLQTGKEILCTRHDNGKKWRASKAMIADESNDLDNVCLCTKPIPFMLHLFSCVSATGIGLWSFENVLEEKILGSV